MGICCMTQGAQIGAEGWDGERDGREVQEGGEMHISMADSCWYMTENHKNAVKQLSLNLKLLKMHAKY